MCTLCRPGLLDQLRSWMLRYLATAAPNMGGGCQVVKLHHPLFKELPRLIELIESDSYVSFVSMETDASRLQEGSFRVDTELSRVVIRSSLDLGSATKLRVLLFGIELNTTDM
ncbi:hypothetical protein K440DRAFT_228672 [Wilcoxina mikolae CBS 423.85]|nr:hypothetical protein K440DRAFT_228672 [Wilcoxina mikolae CBS 423.85]